MIMIMKMTLIIRMRKYSQILKMMIKNKKMNKTMKIKTNSKLRLLNKKHRQKSIKEKRNNKKKILIRKRNK